MLESLSRKDRFHVKTNGWIAPFRHAINCECLEDLRYQTCYPCVDRLLDQKIRHSNRDKWPQYLNPWIEDIPIRRFRSVRGFNKIKWPICPCGREINPIKQPALYPESAFTDLEIDFDYLLEDNKWTLVCIDCDGLWVPRTQEGMIPPRRLSSPRPFQASAGARRKRKKPLESQT